MAKTDKDAKHKAAMQKQKASVDASIEAASTERGVAILLTGDGKGKSSSAFGMVMRALGYGQKVGVVQFIKGEQLSGEEIYLREHCPQVDFLPDGHRLYLGHPGPQRRYRRGRADLGSGQDHAARRQLRPGGAG